MTNKEAKELMEIERTCVIRQDTPDCKRDEYGCGACDLVQSGDDVIEAYGVAIKKALEAQEWISDERRPEIDQEVLLNTESFGIVTGVYKTVDFHGEKKNAFCIHRSISSSDLAVVTVKSWRSL